MNEERLSAIKNGKNKYTGAPCRTCGGTLRFVNNNNCSACAALAGRKYRANIRALIEKARAGGL
jgi:ribosomal protein L37E